MGDAACWLDQLCPVCSAMLEDKPPDARTVVCWRCGASIRFGDDGPIVA